MQKMKAVIIGAGGGGLAVLNAMLKAGFDVEVVDRGSEIGGIWSSTRYPNLTIHSKSFNYRFIDFPPIPSKNERATREEILEYMHRFTSQRNGHRYIRFNTEVELIRYCEDNGSKKCEVIARNVISGQATKVECDIVVCALGFSNGGKPHLPSFQGAADFRGTVVHSSGFTQEMLNDVLANRKKVVIYGAGKSSHELLSLFQGHPEIDLMWIYKKSLWAISYDKMYERGRLRFLLNYGYYLFLCSLRQKMGAYNRLLYVLERPLIWNGLFLNPLEPESNIFQNRMAIMGSQQYDYLRSIRSIKSEIVQLFDNGIRLMDGQDLPADYLICATGYERASNLPRILVLNNGNASEHDFTGQHSLYLNMIDPKLPSIALFTSNLVYSQQIFGFSIAAEWLVRFYSGTLQNRPSLETMAAVLDGQKRSHSSWYSYRYLSKGGPYYFDKDNFVMSGILYELGIPKRVVLSLLFNSTDERRFNKICATLRDRLSISAPAG